VHLAFLVDTELVSWKQTIDIREWKDVMMEEFEAIEKKQNLRASGSF